MKYISVDSGKYKTKVSCWDDEKKSYREFGFRTKTSEGDFRDDMLGAETYLAKVNGKTYKVGYEARKEAEVETSKQSETHKISTLTAIAMVLADDHKEKDEAEDICVVIGVPYETCCNVDERLKYKDYILPADGSVTVEIKRTSVEKPISVTFRCKERYVYPESSGVLYKFPRECEGVTGIIDIGNVNINHTYSDTFSITNDYGFTNELGGKSMISGLALALSAGLNKTCNEDLVAKVLCRPLKERHLTPVNGDKEIEAKSAQIITDYLKNYVEGIKTNCKLKKWSLDFMKIVVIGGTANLITNELKEVFGENVYIPEFPEYVNAQGFLLNMVSNIRKKEGQGNASDVGNAILEYEEEKHRILEEKKQKKEEAANKKETIKKGA